ncbi:MAG TPA: hypothetical protein VMW29_01610 [Candidatus Bathyarchaeia archaeon]|nr:hypothetical protein [Candidatus Bathyarchaeia archaeon]
MERLASLIYEYFFLKALLLTIFVETLILLIIIKVLCKNIRDKTQIKDIIIVGIISSSLTLPYLWFILPSFNLPNYLFIGEFLTILLEAYLFRKFLKVSLRHAFLFSLIVNVSSFLIGKIISFTF